MTVAAFVLFVVAVVVMVVVHVKLERKSLARDEARQHALYKQHKELTRRTAAAQRATSKMVDETRATSSILKEDARLLHERADALLRDHKAGG